MRHTQPLSAEEEKLGIALRSLKRSHVEQDRALTEFRLARLRGPFRAVHLERCADALLGEVAL